MVWMKVFFLNTLIGITFVYVLVDVGANFHLFFNPLPFHFFLNILVQFSRGDIGTLSLFCQLIVVWPNLILGRLIFVRWINTYRPRLPLHYQVIDVHVAILSVRRSRFNLIVVFWWCEAGELLSFSRLRICIFLNTLRKLFELGFEARRLVLTVRAAYRRFRLAWDLLPRRVIWYRPFVVHLESYFPQNFFINWL